jgi:hypothetical protein
MKVLKPPQSGSQNGTTASHNRYGQYERTRAMPVQPIASPRRAEVRANFTAATSAWAALTPTEQEAWNTYAGSHPRTDALGQSMILTGHAMYVAIAASCLNLGIVIPTIPPADDTLPAVSNMVFYADASPSVVVKFDQPGVNYGFALAYSRPQSGGVSFTSTFRQFEVASALLLAVDLTDDIVAAYGAPVEGQNMFQKLTPFNTDGVIGAGQRSITRVVAASALPVPAVSVGGSASWTGGASFDVYVWVQAGGVGPFLGTHFAAGASSGGPIGTGASGDVVYVRLFDGTAFSTPSTPTTLT